MASIVYGFESLLKILYTGKKDLSAMRVNRVERRKGCIKNP